jgi:hypothetical protein
VRGKRDLILTTRRPSGYNRDSFLQTFTGIAA